MDHLEKKKSGDNCPTKFFAKCPPSKFLYEGREGGGLFSSYFGLFYFGGKKQNPL